MKINKSKKLTLGRETVANLDAVQGGTPVPNTSICTVTQGPICHTLRCVTYLTDCLVSG